MAIKNKKVGGHVVSLLLSCGCVITEPCDAAIYLPNMGEKRTCDKHEKEVVVQRVGGLAWADGE